MECQMNNLNGDIRCRRNNFDNNNAVKLLVSKSIQEKNHDDNDYKKLYTTFRDTFKLTRSQIDSKTSSSMTKSESVSTSNIQEIPNEEIAVKFNSNVKKRGNSESSVDDFDRNNQTLNEDGCHLEQMWRNELIIGSESTAALPLLDQNTKQIGGYYDYLTKREKRSRKNISDIIDVAIRVVLVIVFAKLETVHSFHRKIQMEELWLYKNPRMPDIVSPRELLLIVIFAPFVLTILRLLITRNYRDFRAANWTWTLALGMNGLITSLLKITVGRPRPDFFYRCFPDGVMVLNNAIDVVHNGTLNILNCTGDPKVINEGYKSFPSGHSSFAFVAGTFIALYMSGKLRVFTQPRHGESWRLCITIAPLIWAAMVAVSRTCDYHHHWQDVLIGGIIGTSVTLLVYRQYYPSIFASNCDIPLSAYFDTIPKMNTNRATSDIYMQLANGNNENGTCIGEDCNSVNSGNKQNKWC